MMLSLCLAALLVNAAPTPIEAVVPSRKEPVSYAKEVADILDAKCVGCHSANLAQSRLNIEDVAGMLKGGKRGPSIVPGKADESLLFRLAAHRLDPVMPPPKEKKGGEPLTPAELGLLKLWIDAGAKDDSSENSDEPKSLELGTLPPGVQPVVAVDLTQDGSRIAAGRANVVQVHDADSGLVINSLGGHKDIIQSIRFSPDGKRLAAGSYQIVTLWNVPTGGLTITFSGHTDQVKAITLVDDGKLALSGSLDRSIRSWHLADGKESSQWTLPGPITALAATPDGRLLAAGAQDGLIQVLNRADGKPLYSLRGHTGTVNALVFSPDAKRLVSVASDGTARIWSLPTEETVKGAANPDAVKPSEPIVLAGHKGPVNAVALTPDGQMVVTAGDDASIRIWHAIDGKSSKVIEGSSGPILAMALSPDGLSLLTGSSDRRARLIDLASGSVRHTLSGHEGAVNAVAFSPKGDRLATAGADGSLKVWETATGQGIIAFGHTSPNAATLQPILKVAFENENTIISASADHTLKRWAFEGTWSETKPLGPHVFRVLALDFSPDGTLLATGGGDPSRSGEVKIWNVQTGTLVRSLDALHSDTVFGVRFSPDGSKLATAAADKFLKVVNVADGKELRSFEGHTHHVMAVDWSSDGKKLLTGGADNVLKVWDYETGEQLRTLQPAGKQVTAVRWITGKAEVAGASGDALVRLWNADNGGIARNFSGPSDYVFGVGVSRDGKRIVAGGADSFLFLWNGENAQVVRRIGPSPHP